MAKLKGDAAQVSPLSQMPTQDPSAPLTAEGTILGTLQYMAPEQLEGKEADARTDIFAFGALVYEMVIGKKAFEGTSQASLIAAIIEREPEPLIQLQPTTPRALDRVVRRCLAKDPDERWQTAADLMHEVKWIATDSTGAGESAVARSSGRDHDRRVLILSVTVLTLIAIVTGIVIVAPYSSAPKMILEITTPPTTEPGSLAISPDGKKIVFVATSEGEAQLLLRSLESGFDLYEQSTAGGEERLLFRSELNKLPMDWTADGRFLLYRSLDPAAGYDLWALRMDGSGEAFPVVQTDADDRDGKFSPDGSWIAYQSNRSGQFEIYVQPFPGPGRPRQISPSGGTQVRWRADSRELFYIGLDDRLMAVPMEWTPGSDSFEPGRPRALFPTKVGGALQGVMPQQYAVSADGERFLMNLVLESDGNQPITVILNWQPGTIE